MAHGAVDDRRPRPAVLIDELKVVCIDDTVVFQGDGDDERIASDVHVYLDCTR